MIAEQHAIALAKEFIGRKRAAKQNCDGAHYISARGNKKGYWSVLFKIPLSNNVASRDPSHNIICVFDDGRVKEFEGL